MSSLRELHFVAESGDDLAPLLAARDQPIFPSLRKLSPGNSDQHSGALIPSCTAVLEKIHSGVLQDASLDVVAASSSPMRQNLLSALHVRRLTLQKLCFTEASSWTGQRHSLNVNDVLEDDDITPLLSLATLTHLRLSYIRLHDMSDTMLIRMAASWPALKSLKIGTYLGWRQRSRVTFDGLAGLIQFCPELHELTLAMDISRNSLDLEHDEVAQNQHITTVDLLDSAIVATEDGDALDSAAWSLAALLPRLERIVPSRPLWQLPPDRRPLVNDPAQACWEAIRREIGTLRSPRRQVASRYDGRRRIPFVGLRRIRPGNEAGLKAWVHYEGIRGAGNWRRIDDSNCDQVAAPRQRVALVS
ncbi:uncharacterized protein FIBRA_05112 [Fibroporia radiculosa]|uniref:F-box domain-containing protein n=1 Tax=Fibroporia radiculosa TaxID=599839 RepID=J4HWZ7_9APHY|nr:uncharacterized protein FIBRA_05112 [Fibroporia radiculosa]CCM02997.1 predicted protein [Fibroporia radiculosa]